MGIVDSVKKKFNEVRYRNYDKKIRAGLDEVYKETKTLDLDLDKEPLVFVSDLHKGTGDKGADDFMECREAYETALEHYDRELFRLFVVGDVEELWEDSPAKVIAQYGGVLQLEAQFHAAGRYERLWGNHDDLWSRADKVADHLHDFYEGLVVHEALKYRVKSGGEELGVLFVVHGHQGTPDSDSKSPIPRLFVRHVWRRFQRITKKSLNTPSKTYDLRLRHNRAMYDWAAAHPDAIVMIAGHTHKPVFWERAGAGQSFEQTRPEIGIPGTQQQPVAPPTHSLTVPCYFNTGCCAFSDGDVTAIEVRDGRIRLVRWLDDDRRPQAKVLTAEEDIADVFARVAAASAPGGTRPPGPPPAAAVPAQPSPVRTPPGT